MDAHRGLDSFLGRLTTVLVDEAQLLGRVRSDVEFIMDEMESMNGLILHLTEAQHRDHQVRAWMKQVVGLTRDCEGNVELYVHYVGNRPGDDDDGLLGHLRRIARFLRTIAVRHRIATRIRELKVRARDIGDRRQRYGVTVPESTMNAVDPEPLRWSEELRRRTVLLDAAQPPGGTMVEVVRRGIESLTKCLSTEPATTQDEDGGRRRVRICIVLGHILANTVAEHVYQQCSSMASTYGCKAWSDGGYVGRVLAEILEELGGVQLQPGQEDDDELTNQAAGTTSVREETEKRLVREIQRHLKGKRFLIVVGSPGTRGWVSISRQWKRILDALLQAADRCLPGSAIIMTTLDDDLAQSSSPYKIIDALADREFYKVKTTALLGGCPTKIHDMVDLCGPDTFALKTFLHLLSVNPNRTKDELRNYDKDISECRRLNRSIPKQVLSWCYTELPSKYRSCLLYLIVFPEGHIIRTTSLARRWVAEGLVTATTTSTTAVDEIRSSTDEAEHCLDVLFLRGFVSPLEISAEGNIKSCTVHREVQELVARVATDVNFMDSSLPLHLARYLSIHNRIRLQKSHSDGESKDIAAYLPALAASCPQWQLLKVLDLEGCKGLANKNNLRSICKILLLKYLSLRNTDIAELPKQMKELQCLETLDIRQTKVPALAKKAIVLPLLKHFLAGDKIYVSNDATKSEGSFSAVDMPIGIHRMNNLEILSHVQVTNSSCELTGIAELQKLRKLGVALRGPSAKLSDLFRQIDKLHKCLRSLSVRLDQTAASENHGDLIPPKFVRSLNISGLTSGLPHLVQQLLHLAKLTLTETYLNDDGLRILGKLTGLRYLRLLHKSYIQNELSFKEDEFETLNFLLVATSEVTSISFAIWGAPGLERIIWCFPTTACVSGLRHLHWLKEFVLNGDCNPNQVRDEIERHRKPPVFKHNPNVQNQENIAAASTSSTSAP